jgi:broad specificity phosphatase PhoE
LIGETIEIYLVRHGQSLHNVEDRIAGQNDSELTELGFQDARNVAAAIRRSDFEIVYCSDLLRARQTAETIRDFLKLECPIVYSSLLRELDYGEFTEKPVSEAFSFMNYKVSQKSRYPGGEGFIDLEDRARRFISQLKLSSSSKRILIVAHAGSIRVLAMLFDPERRQEHLSRTYGNRFIGRVTLNGDEKLVSLQVIQNPDRALLSL